MSVNSTSNCDPGSGAGFRHSAIIAAGLLWLMFALSASGQMYPGPELEAKKIRIQKNLAYVVTRDIPAHTEPDVQASAKKATLSIELRGMEFLDFRHQGNAVVVPIDALQFLDDFVTVRAWFDLKGCDATLLQNYVFRLTEQDHHALSPMDAFGLNRDEVLRDQAVDRVAGIYYETAVWFLLAHEVGHVARSQAGVSPIADEDAADDFALDVMRRKHLLPAGIVLYLTAISLSDHGHGAQKHAVSAERVRHVADALRRKPEEFVSRDSKSAERDRLKVLKMADELSALARSLKTILSHVDTLRAGGEDLVAKAQTLVFPTVDYKKACAAQSQ